MFNLGPIDLVVVGVLSVRKYGLLRSTLGALGLAAAFSYAQPPRPCGCFRPMFVRCSWDRGYLATVKSDLKNLASQEEIYFADRQVYSVDMSGIGFVPSQGVRITVFASTDRWSAWATHDALGDSEGCGIYIGDEPLFATENIGSGQPGELVCTG